MQTKHDVAGTTLTSAAARGHVRIGWGGAGGAGAACALHERRGAPFQARGGRQRRWREVGEQRRGAAAEEVGLVPAEGHRGEQHGTWRATWRTTWHVAYNVARGVQCDTWGTMRHVAMWRTTWARGVLQRGKRRTTWTRGVHAYNMTRVIEFTDATSNMQHATLQQATSSLPRGTRPS
jgi:hypothetical protein